MFAALYSVSSPVATLTRVAQSFSPRVEVSGRLVLCDLVGVARLFGGARDIAEHLRRALVDAGAVRVAVAPTHTAAALLALGRPGLSVAATSEEARVALALLPVATLAEWDTIHVGPPDEAARRAHDIPSGWVHPRDTHPGPQTRRQVRGRVQMPHGNRKADDAARTRAIQALDVLRRWGIRTLGQYAALPAAELSSRLGPLGPRWQRAAYGQDMSPLVPLVDDEPFEASLALEWPVEGLEPLSFVLGRVLEPLAARLERADRGAAVLHTELHLTSRERHLRTLQLPAPMRDPKTLRTLILLDLESHPPSAGIDRVVVRVDPTPGRIVQWSLLERAQPSTEQVSTLLARLSALMGESPCRLARSWSIRGAPVRLLCALSARLAARSGSPQAALQESFRRFPPLPPPGAGARHPARRPARAPDARSTRRERRRRRRTCRALAHVGRPGGDEHIGRRRPPVIARFHALGPRRVGRRARRRRLCRLFLEREVGQWFIDGNFQIRPRTRGTDGFIVREGVPRAPSSLCPRR